MVHIRSMKQFNRGYYLRDLEQKNWHNIYFSVVPNVMWKIWKENLMRTIDKLNIKKLLGWTICPTNC